MSVHGVMKLGTSEAEPGDTRTMAGSHSALKTKAPYYKLAAIWKLGHPCIMGLCRRQFWLKVTSCLIFLYIILMLFSYVWKPLKINSIMHDDLSGYGLRKLLEDDDSLLERHRAEDLERRLPQCIIFGVRKCGTRALLEFLDLHPQILTADHEMHFFNEAENYAQGIRWYRRQMPLSFPEQITIEKTPRYFISEEAPARIQAMNSSIKLIVIFRNPITRVISDYAQVYENKVARNKSVERFEDIVYDPVRDRINTGFKAIRISMYHHHLQRWLSYFPRRQIHIVDGDNLVTNPLQEVSKVEQFLGLNHRITEDNLYFNESRGFYCMKSEHEEHCLGASKGRKHPTIDPVVIEKLQQFYQPYNAQLFKMIGFKLNWNSR